MPSIRSKRTATDSAQFQLLNEIGIIDQLAQYRASQLLAPALNMPQFIVLNHFVRLHRESSLVDLSAAMQVTKGAMTNTVARLLAKGFVTVAPDPRDGRGKRVRITAAGRRARTRAVSKLAEGLSALGGVLSREELSQSLLLLRKIRVWFDTNR